MPFKNVIYLDKYHVIEAVPGNEEDTAKNETESFSLGTGKREGETTVRQTWIKTRVQPQASHVTIVESRMPWLPLSTQTFRRNPLNPSADTFRKSFSFSHSRPQDVCSKSGPLRGGKNLPWNQERQCLLESGTTHQEERKPFQIGCRHIASNILLSAELWLRRVRASNSPFILRNSR